MSAEYNPKEIESKWQKYWQENNIYHVENQSDKQKYYVLDMFPYPSGAGLHVGHPLGYIATDIFSRYKKMQGFNVLHPMGFDSFGLPAEQYAIETGQHPAITTEKNIQTFKKQLAKIGFNHNKDREIQTSSPEYYKWTQWIFQQLFNSYFNNDTKKAENIEDLIAEFEKNGNQKINAACDENTPIFSAKDWQSKSEKEQQQILLHYRLAFIAEATVNWCAALGMVLANDEVKDGLSERGGHPVERKKMRQWMMRITAYADRLLNNLDTLEWSDAVKEMQRNWIGKSIGCEIDFYLTPLPPLHLERGDIQTSNKSVYYPNLFTTHPEKWKHLKELARNNRKNPTEAEDILWQELRNQKLGFKIRRQHAIEDFIVDFVCLEKKLVIEVDGEYHNEEEQKEYDDFRTWTLQNVGFNEIRFTNQEILNDLNKVLEKIKNTLKSNSTEGEISFDKSQTKNTPSPNGEGAGGEVQKLTAFTTRIDTIFGVSYLVLAPEHEMIPTLTTPEQKEEVEKYVNWAKNRSELERQSEVKSVSGVFTGSYAINPFNNEKIPIWIADYVLAGYGTGVVMGVPSSDDRDFRFAKYFNLPIRLVIEGTENMENPTEKKYGKMINSDFLDGLETQEAIQKAIEFVEKNHLGKSKVNFRLRDAAFSRQRYWGEPMPVYYKDGLPYLIDEKDLPLVLPEINEYKPTADGEPPLARAKDWTYKGFPLETTTMPGWAGSSWYFLRYMDNKNKDTFASKQATDYWNQVDLYVGGTEHAVGHLLYSRFWTNFLYDKGFLSFQEPFKKMINQGMIQGQSALIYRLKNENTFISWNLKNNYHIEDLQILHVDVNIVENNILNIEAFKKWRIENENAIFVLENDKFVCGSQVEKMSKRWYNVVNPDDVIDKYSADTLRLYEMFLGPLEQYKPWNTQGIDGCYKFLKRLWRLFYDNEGNLQINDETPTPAELKVLHKAIKGVTEDLERYSFNTPVSKFMILVGELTDLKCHKKAILETFLRLLVPYTPHITEELWQNALGNKESIYNQDFPIFDEKYLIENDFNYPIQINGKVRLNISFALSKDKATIEKEVLTNENVQKYLEGKTPKKVIVVEKKIINIVI
jgi:leucyl-tRNA synthetase